MAHVHEQIPTVRQRVFSWLFWGHLLLWMAYASVAGVGPDHVSDLVGRMLRWFYSVVIVALTAEATVYFLVERRRRRRAETGLCQGCGYDLRASWQSGRCPECGRLITPAERAEAAGEW